MKKVFDQRLEERMNLAATRGWIVQKAQRAAAMTVVLMEKDDLEELPAKLTVFRNPSFAAFRHLLRTNPAGLGKGELAARELFHTTYQAEMEKLRPTVA
jgi:hypothetical protein